MATKKVTPSVLQQLRGLNRKVKQAHDTGAMGQLLAANQEFHFHIYALTESPVILPIIEGLWLRCGPTMYFALGSPGLWDSSSHMDILDALERHDEAGAEEAMARDIMKTGDELVRQVVNGSRTGPMATHALSSFIPKKRA
jgi:DNA-binding GntR family transcriptional regulator